MKMYRARRDDEPPAAPERDEGDHAARERNAGLAIAVLALVVVGLLLAIVLGATDAFRP